MELNSEIPTAPPRNASTVVMLRDSPGGLEVFLVKRHGLSDVLGGAYVFPGGKLDPADCELDPAAHLDQAPTDLHAALGEPHIDATTATGLYVAALREAFEESRVLFSHDMASAKAALLHDKAKPFNQLLAELQVRLQTRNVVPWSRWITPRMPSITNKRFDTRFFVAAVPHEQEATHDNHEATESVWLAPRAALEQYWDRKIELAPPQIMSLAHLARHASVGSVMQAARAQLPPLILPETLDEDGIRVLCYPGDPAHSVRPLALPGPTRLMFRNKRFEPIGGFEALFS
ncbi:MAG TPA: NUDIX hydrolase [Rhodoferax sp.]|mgnify:CR=1 FL=1|jgi:8-oxo-dGTP pyrophosphatase MutT (NUDIX family)|nr:NUDIX hydrolase [Rhodoferax sp.]HPW29249.1 NUDIX hydrolase [Rhodoferax sp.]